MDIRHKKGAVVEHKLTNATDAIIVADASFDQKHQIAGFGGVLHIPQTHGANNIQYQGVQAECQNVQHAELSAILLGLLTLKRQSATDDLLKVRKITIYSDSESAIDQHIAMLNNAHVSVSFKQELEAIIALTQKYGWDYELKKVASHRPSHAANPIEKLHNIADELANEAKQRALKHLFEPSKKSKYVTVFLSSGYNERQAQEFENIGHKLAQDGHIIRLHFDDDPLGQKHTEDHPFIKGVLNYASQSGKDTDTLLDLNYYNPHETPESLDLTLYRHHQHEIGNKDLPPIHSKYSLTQRKAAFASSLIFGPASRGLGSISLTGRLMAASAFVLDLNPSTPEKGSIRDWVYTHLTYVNIDLKKGFKMRDIHIPHRGLIRREVGGGLKPNQEDTLSRITRNQQQSAPMKEPSEDASLQIKHVFQQAIDHRFSAHQLCHLIRNILETDGLHIASSLGIQSLERHVHSAMASYNHPHSDRNRMVSELYKHIHRTRLTSLPAEPNLTEETRAHVQQSAPLQEQERRRR